MMIRAENLSKFYQRRCALDRVSFSIEQGEVIGFLGPNGAGKTTLLKILSGAVAPSAGHFAIAGHSSDRDPLEIRRRIGFLPDRPPLYGEMTVTGMLLYGAQLNGLDRRRASVRVSEVLEQCQLEAVRDDIVDWLSHGFRQRVGIALAIVHEPELVILDEPITGLDPQQIVEARQLIRRLAHKHTVLLSSHILAEVEHCCDRFLILNHGRIVAQGEEPELRELLVPGRFVLRGRGPAGAVRDLCGALPGIELIAVAASGAESFELVARSRDDGDREALVSALVHAGMGINSLENDHRGGLEPVFLQLTRRPDEQESAA